MAKNSNKSRLMAACGAVVLAMGVSLTMSLKVLATTGGNSGGGNVTNSGHCDPGQINFTWHDSCYGAGWKLYTADSDNITIAGSNSGTTQGGVIKDCKTYGGQYYRLGYANYQKNSSGQLVDMHTQTGLVPVNGILNYGGSITYHSYGISMSEAKAKFEEAKKNGIKMPTSWENTSWFCWSKDPIFGEAKVTSTSSVSAEGQSATSEKDGKAEITIETDKDSVEVKFWHNLQLDNSATKGSFDYESIEVSWTVSETGGQNRKTVNSGKETFTAADLKGGSKETGKLSEDTVTVKPRDDGGTTTVCHTIKYNPKLFKFEIDNGKFKATGSSNGSSQACVKIKGKKDEEEPDPDPEDSEGAVGYDEGKFWSVSSVGIEKEQNDIPVIPKQSSSSNGNSRVDVRVSTDQDNVTVKFWHDLYWDDNLWDVDAVKKPEKEEIYNKNVDPDDLWNFTDEDVDQEDKFLDEICTDWTVTRDGQTVATGNTCADDSKSKEVHSNEYDITDLQIGQETKVCQKITHDETIKLKVQEVLADAEQFQGNYTSSSCQTKTNSDTVEYTLDSNRSGKNSGQSGYGKDEYVCVYKTKTREFTGYNAWGQAQYSAWKDDGDVIEELKEKKYDSTIVQSTLGLSEGATGGTVENLGKKVKMHARWEVSEDSRYGEGWSEACITVVRANDPDLPSTVRGPWSTATAKNSIMYAGESATIGWEAQAKYWDVRRLVRYEGIAFMVPVNVNYDDLEQNGTNILEGNISPDASDWRNEKGFKNQRVDKDPCTWFATTKYAWCGAVDGHNADMTDIANSTHHYDASENIVVPNYVGYKYCNAWGYKWEYYWGSSVDGGAWNWSQAYKPYWTNYAAACRTIAKKPVVAFWNSGVMTNGGIFTLNAPRSTSGDGASKPVNSNAADWRLYGSWAEYLAVVGGQLDGFASGATLSRGGQTLGDVGDIMNFSPLTIANSRARDLFGRGNLGWSGVTTSPTLVSRLTTYLKEWESHAGPMSVGSNVTKIIQTGYIGSDIINTSDSHSTIYTIPSTIIFWDGDVEIAPGVKQIDAWIIAGGTVNTCSQFTTAVTTTLGAAPLGKQEGYSDGKVTCDTPLVINGPVIADKVLLNRTYGADPQDHSYWKTRGQYSEMYTPSEVFNLSAETYLWGYAQAGRYDSSYTEAYSRELAPRY